jgi:hypothetical protein
LPKYQSQLAETPVSTARRSSKKQPAIKVTKIREYPNVAPGYVSWVKNVIAPALVEAYLREKAKAGGPRA